MNRKYYMDNLRACMMLSGVLLHSMLFLTPLTLYHYWPISNSSTSAIYYYLVILIHVWYMPLFYLLGGYFSKQIFKKHGSWGFIKNRLLRIGLPFLVSFALFTLYHIGEFIAYYKGGISLSWANLYAIFGFIGPLWFIYYLLFFYPMVLICHFIYIKFFQGSGYKRKNSIPYATLKTSSPLPLEQTQKISNLDIYFTKRPLLLIFIFVCLGFLIFFLGGIIFLDPPLTITLVPTVLLFYFSFFLFGWICYDNLVYFDFFSRYSWILLLLALLVSYPLFAFLSHNKLLLTAYPMLKLWLKLINPLNSWLLSLGFLGVFYRWINVNIHTLRYLADGSYWIYLIEVPVILVFQSYFILHNLPMFLKLWYVFICSMIVLVLSYRFMVRKTFIGVMLNGKRR